MKDYSTMSDFEINKLVIESLGGEMTMKSVASDQHVFADVAGAYVHKDYCNNPADAWPIILENKINIDHRESINAGAMASQSGRKEIYAVDKNPLRGAMIVFLMMKDAAVNTQGEKV